MGNCCSAPEPAPTDFEPETEPEPADEPEPEPAEDEPEPADERLSLEAALKMAKQYQDLKAKLEAAEQGLPPQGDPAEIEAMKAQLLAFQGDEGAQMAVDLLFVKSRTVEGASEQFVMDMMDRVEQKDAELEVVKKEHADYKKKDEFWEDDTAPFGEGKKSLLFAQYSSESEFVFRRDLREAHAYGVKFDSLWVIWNEGDAKEIIEPERSAWNDHYDYKYPDRKAIKIEDDSEEVRPLSAALPSNVALPLPLYLILCWSDSQE